ncbi:MAG: 16S rRNA (adenine(1518)-N(6)/adenine(1519)-N(6))-dimethyltransferase, partial [Acidobacteria bacterium]|nr:16S rRNA (adenine(1518)-N(6)/adenine(1519)-N(6))-dimethyltransferase [Acidobacteriota bacterium]
AGARVVAWELDASWAVELRRRARHEGLAIVVGDALAIPWSVLPRGFLVAGNLPYQVGTTILRAMLTSGEGVPRAAFLLQREVVDRIVAGPGSKAYGAFSVEVAARARARLLGRVRPGSFRPPPRVESAFVGLERHPPPIPEAEMPAFLRVVYLAFSQRRKTLRNALGGGWGRERAEMALREAAIDPGARAESLPLKAFVSLYRAFTALP